MLYGILALITILLKKMSIKKGKALSTFPIYYSCKPKLTYKDWARNNFPFYHLRFGSSLNALQSKILALAR